MMRALAGLTGAVAVVAMAGAASAQPAERSGMAGFVDRLGAGFYGGISISTFEGNDVDETTMFSNTAKASPTFGGLLTIALEERFALQGEVAFATKGASFADPLGTEGTINLYYIEFPILIKFQRAFTSVALRGYTGFAPAVMLEARIEDQFGGLVDVSSTTRGWDVGWVIAGGLGVGPLFFDLRYEVGLVSVEDGAEGGDIEAHNSVLSLLGGYAF